MRSPLIQTRRRPTATGGDIDESLATATLAVSNAGRLQSARVVRYVGDYQQALPEGPGEVEGFRFAVGSTLADLDPE